MQYKHFYLRLTVFQTTHATFTMYFHEEIPARGRPGLSNSFLNMQGFILFNHNL